MNERYGILGEMNEYTVGRDMWEKEKEDKPKERGRAALIQEPEVCNNSGSGERARGKAE